MDALNFDFLHAGSLEELKAKRRLVVRGRHRPILLVYENGRVFALDNRCPHMGFPLDRRICGRQKRKPGRLGARPGSTTTN